MTDEIKLPLTSADLTEALLSQLRDAAPQIFSEGCVDFTKLQACAGRGRHRHQLQQGRQRALPIQLAEYDVEVSNEN